MARTSINPHWAHLPRRCARSGTPRTRRTRQPSSDTGQPSLQWSLAVVTGIDPERRMASQHVEVSVELQDLHVSPNSNCRDETINQLPWCLTVAATDSVKRGSLLVIDRHRGQHRRASQQSAEFTEMSLVSSSGKDLHPDRFARRDLSVKERVHADADRAPCIAQKFDPCRRVDQDHEIRLARRSSRSPSQPDPRNALAPSTDNGSPASSRSAKLTASRFVVK